jgi:hypothetical protein
VSKSGRTLRKLKKKTFRKSKRGKEIKNRVRREENRRRRRAEE